MKLPADGSTRLNSATEEGEQHRRDARRDDRQRRSDARRNRDHAEAEVEVDARADIRHSRGGHIHRAELAGPQAAAHRSGSSGTTPQSSATGVAPVGREPSIGVRTARAQKREQLQPVPALVEIEVGHQHRRLIARGLHELAPVRVADETMSRRSAAAAHRRCG